MLPSWLLSLRTFTTVCLLTDGSFSGTVVASARFCSSGQPVGFASPSTTFSLTRRKDTSPWWVGPVPQFWGKPRTFVNPSSCFCHGADPIDGHRKVVGQDQYPALGEVRETAKLLPRGESPWWRDEGRHLLILCCFNPRDEISPHE